MPDEPTTLDPSPEQEDALRRTLAAVADATPAPDAWVKIRARATGEADDVLNLGSARGDRANLWRRHPLLIAAAIAVLGGLAAAIVLAVNNDEGENVQIAPDPDANATGWYVPDVLPEGWVLESVETDWRDFELDFCPCEVELWANRTTNRFISRQRMEATSTDGEQTSPDGSDMRSIEIAGVTGYELPDEGEIVLGGSRMGGNVVSDEDLRAATQRVSEGVADPILPDFDLVFRAEIPSGLRAYHSVSVIFRHANSGLRLGYELTPPGYESLFNPNYEPVPLPGGGQFELPITEPRIEALPGQALDVFATPLPPETGVTTELLHGFWPGAQAVIAESSGGPALTDVEVSDEDRRALMASLRPASAEEWAAFVRTATGDSGLPPFNPDVLTERLSDLIVGEGDVLPGDTEPEVTVPEPTTPTGETGESDSEEATGWYIPDPLPDGWVIQSVEGWRTPLNYVGLSCPCGSEVWFDPARRAVVEVATGAFTREHFVGDTVALTDTVNAFSERAGLFEGLEWAVDGTEVRLASVGLEQTELMEIAQRLVSGETVKSAIGEGFELMTEIAADGDAIAFESVHVNLYHPASGQEVGYELVPSGFETFGSTLPIFAMSDDTFRRDLDVIASLDGRLDHISSSETLSGEPPMVPSLLAQRPGAFITVTGSPVPASDADRTITEQLLSWLRPVHGDEWAAFLEDASQDPSQIDPVVYSPSLTDLIHYPGETVVTTTAPPTTVGQ